MTDELISKSDVVKIIKSVLSPASSLTNVARARRQMLNEIDELESKPEPHEIGYDDCSNALLKMWMDNVLTDGDYYRIADKLNKKWGKTELPEPYKEVTE